jgi:hypothetical protein
MIQPCSEMSCHRSARLNNRLLSPAPMAHGRGHGRGGGRGVPFGAREEPAPEEPPLGAGAASSLEEE